MERIIAILLDIKKELQAIRSSLEHERTFIPEDSNGTHTIVGPGTNNPN